MQGDKNEYEEGRSARVRRRRKREKKRKREIMFQDFLCAAGKLFNTSFS
jgi:hypothetical protein